MNETDFAGVCADLTGKIINAAIEVHSELGCGLKEEAYEAALAWELLRRGHKVQRQVPCPVIYKGNVFCQDDEHPKRIDLLVDDKIVVELKAVCTRHPVFAAQCRTYLRMLNLPVGLVLNFGFPSLKEGIEHVSNPKCSTTSLQNFETPSSESNNGVVNIAYATGSLKASENGCVSCSEANLQRLNMSRELRNSETPSSESNNLEEKRLLALAARKGKGA